MCKLCIFAGTTEGRELVSFLAGQPVSVVACVATEYGQTLLPASDNLTVSAGRLTQPEMEALFAREGFDMVIDATHPYAALVTENIAAACQAAGVAYHRLLRSDTCMPENAVFADTIPQAVEYLNRTAGNILLTTGSKELHQFAGMENFSQRVYARVLPMEDSLRLCREAGLQPSHILAMQGPFTQELNAATLKALGAAYLVTKASGTAGGFQDKISAAQACGVTAVIIGRPPQHAGTDLEQTVDMLCGRFGFVPRQEVAVVGIGPGSRNMQTQEAREALARADCIIGAQRMLQAVAAPGQTQCAAISPESICAAIAENRHCRRLAVAMSGDVGFFSGTRKLLPLLGECTLRLIPGISSLVYLCARLGTSYEDVVPVTLHGRENPILLPLSRGRRVFTLVGGENGMGKLCRKLTQAGLGSTHVSAGENLSYPEEKITRGTARELQDHTFAPLCAALLEPVEAFPFTPGMPDEAFLRTEAVPMTKSEIRAVCLSKLALPPEAVAWDVGAGTGSVTVEMALSAPRGQVFAIERKEEAVALLRQNLDKFHADNVSVIPGLAPGCCTPLPAPTHAFLGGTGGNVAEIIALLLEKNPHVRIVATAVTLESIAALTACMQPFRFHEAVSLSVSRTKKAGPYHLLTAQNPIHIFTMQNP